MKSEKSTLTPRQARAAQLVAEAHLKHAEIAEEVGCAPRTLTEWKQLPAFVAKVAELRAAAALKAGGDDASIDTLADRMIRRRSTIKRFDRIVEQREKSAAKLDPDGELGVDSGFIAMKRRRKLEDGAAWIVEETKFDAGLAGAYRDILREAADDQGQRVSKNEHSGPNGGPIQVSATVEVGYTLGVAVDMWRLAAEIAAAGRWPTNAEEMKSIFEEIQARRKAGLLGYPVPEWAVVFDFEAAKREADEAERAAHAGEGG